MKRIEVFGLVLLAGTWCGGLHAQTNVAPRADQLLRSAPPLGVTVPFLPPGAVSVSSNGVLYYQANGAYYLPGMQDGTTVFTTVQP